MRRRIPAPAIRGAGEAVSGGGWIGEAARTPRISPPRLWQADTWGYLVHRARGRVVENVVVPRAEGLERAEQDTDAVRRHEVGVDAGTGEPVLHAHARIEAMPGNRVLNDREHRRARLQRSPSGQCVARGGVEGA